MKLTVNEAASLLGTTEAAIYRWIKQDAIPCQRVNDSYRFHRAELLEWATSHGLSISPSAFPASRRTVDRLNGGFAAALAAGGVHHNVEGTDRESALRAIVKRMPLSDEADRDLLFDVLLAREALGSTGVGEGIAIPHVRAPVVLPANQPAIVLCFLAQPIEFQAIDDRPVDIFFSMVSVNVRSHLYLLSRLAKGLQDPAFKSAILKRASAEVIHAHAQRLDTVSSLSPEDL
ncbi:MAG TPA: PTS sugar transporter subunit IIA [Polyangiaceae bacterium]